MKSALKVRDRHFASHCALRVTECGRVGWQKSDSKDWIGLKWMKKGIRR